MSDFSHLVTFHIGLTTQTGEVLDPQVATRTVIVPTLAAHGYDGFSVQQQLGYWRGVAENSLAVSLFVNQPDEEAVRRIALRLALELNQEAVLYSVQPVSAGLVYSAGPCGE